MIAVIGCCMFFATQNESPERRVEGNTITFERDPKLRIRLPESLRYVGADRWVLYGIADCELHAFVKADEPKSVQELYWVRFEQYVPTKPELHHTYDSPRHATIGGLDFYVDTWPRSNDEKTEAGSDREHIDALVRTKGYKIPANMMYVRLVHLLDGEKHKELMIIYGEHLASSGFTAADLREGGNAHGQWPALENGLIERAKTKIGLEETDKH
ncbi:MAG: hypothetical protein QOG55_317 [Acidobacteriaceae bacterium]|jgi:hypothetical protein|nr:hypothetical protein [Acidobacteriaceae bacterium]